MRVVVGLTGLIGSGKSSAAEYLEWRHHFHRVRFAAGLKDMLRALGLNEFEIEGSQKERPCEMLGGRTPRHAMQTLGDWGRDIITSRLWVNAWIAAVNKLPAGVPVVAEDCRFPNEVDAIRSYGNTSAIIRIVRSGASSTAAGHISELQTFPADITIRNDGSPEELHAALDAHLFGAQAAFS